MMQCKSILNTKGGGRGIWSWVGEETKIKISKALAIINSVKWTRKKFRALLKVSLPGTPGGKGITGGPK